MEDLESGASLGLTQGGEVGINDGGVEGLVTQILADLTQTDAFFQEMGGVGVSQSVDGGRGIDPAGGPSHSISHLNGADAHEGLGFVQELAQSEGALGPAAAG